MIPMCPYLTLIGEGEYSPHLFVQLRSRTSLDRKTIHENAMLKAGG